VLKKTKPGKGLSRRKLLKTGAAMTAFTLAAPTVWAQTIKDITLLQIGGSYSNMPEIAKAASKDLGFKIEMQPVDDSTQINRTLTQPESFDINDVLMYYLPIFQGKGVVQSADAKRYAHDDKTVSIWSV